MVIVINPLLKIHLFDEFRKKIFQQIWVHLEMGREREIVRLVINTMSISLTH